MFGLGASELIIILVIALLVLGPTKLPQAARTIGKGLSEFRRAATDFQHTIEDAAREEEERERSAKLAPTPPEQSVARGQLEEPPAAAPSASDTPEATKPS